MVRPWSGYGAPSRTALKITPVAPPPTSRRSLPASVATRRTATGPGGPLPPTPVGHLVDRAPAAPQGRGPAVRRRVADRQGTDGGVRLWDAESLPEGCQPFGWDSEEA